MTTQQRTAIRRILRFYREHGGSKRSVRIVKLEDQGRTLRIEVKTRWDGGADKLGYLYNYEGCFWIRPRGRIDIVWSFGVSEQHVAFMLDAHLFNGRELKSRPSQVSGKKTHRVWHLADLHPELNRTQLIKLAVAEGINRNTASTQYYHWMRLQKATGKR